MSGIVTLLIAWDAVLWSLALNVESLTALILIIFIEFFRFAEQYNMVTATLNTDSSTISIIL